LAQLLSQGKETRGLFGNRTLGHSFTPRPNTFGGIQTGSSGDFLYVGRWDDSSAFATSWRRIDTAVLYQAVGTSAAAQPALRADIVPQLPVPDYNLPTVPEFAPRSFPETNGWEGTSRTEQALGSALGIGAPAASNATIRRVSMRATSASAARPQPYARSPELSDRLTRIARATGMLSGQGIDVYLGSNVALLQGTVRKPDDCVLLANVLALEPEVQRIDNRLVAEGSGTLLSNRKNR
jgi:hypothetical protein